MRRFLCLLVLFLALKPAIFTEENNSFNAASNDIPIGKKFGYGALNIIGGLGSHLMGEVWGGVTINAGYMLAAGMFIWEASIDWGHPAVGVPGVIGIAAIGASIVYGFVRPFIYQGKSAKANSTSAISLTLIPNIGEIPAAQLSYTFKF
jgi:hypothetical protein